MADLGGTFNAADYLNTVDPYTALRDAMAECGLHPETITETNGFERFKVDGKGGKNGFYTFQIYGEVGFGCFGDWSKDLHVNWSSVSENTMTVSERLMYQQIRETAVKQREKEKASKHASAKIVAEKHLAEYMPVIHHQYLTEKGVCVQPDFRVNTKKELLIPVIDISGEIMSYQRISESGSKKFLVGGKIVGGMYCIAGDNKSALCVCEGVATGLSINAATGYSVICAFNAGNLKEVAGNVKKQSPTGKIVICADNDYATDGNPGVTKGKEAADSIGALCVYPLFKESGEVGTDFNDLANVYGLDEVTAQIRVIVTGGPIDINRSNILDLSECFNIEPPKREWLINGLIPAGKVGAIVGAGGTGKSNFTLLLARIMASGWELADLKTNDKKKILIVNVEDDSTDIKRRLYAQGQQYGLKEGELYYLGQNLMIYSGVGIVKPFMRTDGANPQVTEWAGWLDRSIANTKPDCVVLDTRSRLYGLDENNNDHAAQWIGMLEGLVTKYGCTFLTVHHVGKAKSGSHDQTSARGASAFVDNCRFVLSLAGMDETVSKKYGLVGKEWKYFSMTASKANYAEGFLPVWFEKMDEGVPVSVDLQKMKDDNISANLLRIISEIDGDFSKRELLKDGDFSLFRETVKEQIGITNRELDMWISRLLESEKLIIKEVNFGGQRPKKCLQVA